MIVQKLRGRYRLDEHLGEGNQGNVYLAFDEEIGRQVAIKIMRPGDSKANSSTETQLRVRQEAQATARFEHLNVVRIFDFQVTEDGVPFLVMEYLKGETLDRLQLPLADDLLLLLVKQVCAALQNAHDRGLVHRDLKPANIMLVDRGKPEQRFVILDLGVAKLTDQGRPAGHFTHAGAGTPLYMSPEQVDGQPTDFRSDVYSFGTMLFEMLTGCRPFASRSESLGELLKAVCERQAPELQEVYPPGRFSPQMEALIRQCMAKDPQQRPGSMREVAERFEAAQRGGRLSAPPPKPFPMFAAGAMLLLVVLAGGGFYYQPQLRQLLSSNSPVTPPPEKKHKADPQNTTNPETSGSSLSFADISDREIDEERLFSLEPRLHGVSSSTEMVRYTLSTSPKCSAEIDEQGHVSWRPTEADGPGEFQFTIQAASTGESERSAETSFRVKVRETNQAPQFAPLADVVVLEGQSIAIPLKATDADLPANRLTFALAGEVPSGVKIDPQRSALLWTPAASHAGQSHALAVSVTDDGPTPAQNMAQIRVAVLPLKVQNSLGMQLVGIPGGEFEMGDAADDPVDSDSHVPSVRVQIARPFLMGTCEVTQGQYKKVVGNNPSGFTHDNLKDFLPGIEQDDIDEFPVESVSVEDALAFCQRLSDLPEEQAAGRRYRLPTEAEWEYACRAGTKSRFHCGGELSESVARFAQRDDIGCPAKVAGQRRPNAWGLFDMHGNVWEYCGAVARTGNPSEAGAANSSDLEYVIRGGGWYDLAEDCRSALWVKLPAPNSEIGFRVVCELVPVRPE